MLLPVVCHFCKKQAKELFLLIAMFVLFTNELHQNICFIKSFVCHHVGCNVRVNPSSRRFVAYGANPPKEL